jgi:hypothetical protein
MAGVGRAQAVLLSPTNECGAVSPTKEEILRFDTTDELVLLMDDSHLHGVTLVEGNVGQIDSEPYLPTARCSSLRHGQLLRGGPHAPAAGDLCGRCASNKLSIVARRHHASGWGINICDRCLRQEERAALQGVVDDGLYFSGIR